MRQSLVRADSLRLAKAFIVEHPHGSLVAALTDSACPRTALLAALLHASGYNAVAIDSTGSATSFLAGPTRDTATLQLTFEDSSGKVTGTSASLVEKVYQILSAYEHELLVVVYLPPDMRRARILAVCARLGIEEEFFRSVIRNW